MAKQGPVAICTTADYELGEPTLCGLFQGDVLNMGKMRVKPVVACWHRCDDCL